MRTKTDLEQEILRNQTKLFKLRGKRHELKTIERRRNPMIRKVSTPEITALEDEISMLIKKQDNLQTALIAISTKKPRIVRWRDRFVKRLEKGIVRLFSSKKADKFTHGIVLLIVGYFSVIIGIAIYQAL